MKISKRKKSSPKTLLKKKCLKEWGIRIRERDNNTCQWCGCPGNQPHHIVQRGNSIHEGWFDLRNGITLCWNCHMNKIHGGYVFESRDFLKHWLARRGLRYGELKLEFKKDGFRPDEEWYKKKLDHLKNIQAITILNVKGETC